MTAKLSQILNFDGQPYVHKNGKPRRELTESFATQQNKKQIRASYDAAQDTDDHRNHWASADAYDADSANSKAVRAKLVQRSRYEIANNGYADGIAQTYATTLAGNGGPQLRMQTGSNGFNQLIEARFYEWAQEVNLAGKLWTLAHAKYSDGEGLGVLRSSQGITNPVKLDWVLYETEQCTTPMLPYGQPGYIDGIRFDENGNPLWYDFVKFHPGGQDGWLSQDPERVPARFVTHWFKQRRPGQHRGIPENASTLNLGAGARRWREATLAHAEHIAKLTVLLKTLMQPSTEDADNVAAMSTLEMLTGMMVALPNTVEPVQLDPKQPAANYEMFHKTLVNEQARPKSMPYIVAACDASGSNYATGRLDHQNYYAALDTDRDDGDRQVLNVIFNVWFDEAVRVYGWLGGNPASIGPAGRAHLWDWPKHRVIDIEAEANANDKKLKNGSIGLHEIYSEDGRDYEDEIQKQAASNGITPDQQRTINMLLNVPQNTLPFVAQVLGIAPPQQAKPVGAPNAQAA
jgi:capsid protein